MWIMKTKERLMSLDVLRGLDLFFLVGLESVMHPLASAIDTEGFHDFMWNFSHVDLQVPDDVLVENVHLTDSLMTLLYKINEMYYSGDEDMHEANLKEGLPVKPLQDTDEE